MKRFLIMSFTGLVLAGSSVAQAQTCSCPGTASMPGTSGVAASNPATVGPTTTTPGSLTPTNPQNPGFGAAGIGAEPGNSPYSPSATGSIPGGTTPGALPGTPGGPSMGSPEGGTTGTGIGANP
jgi:hypothetical protein